MRGTVPSTVLGVNRGQQIARLLPVTEEERFWTHRDIAEFLGITESSVRVYVAQGEMPPPDERYGVTNLWKPATIREWAASRPRKGKGNTDD